MKHTENYQQIDCKIILLDSSNKPLLEDNALIKLSQNLETNDNEFRIFLLNSKINQFIDPIIFYPSSEFADYDEINQSYIMPKPRLSNTKFDKIVSLKDSMEVANKKVQTILSSIDKNVKIQLNFQNISYETAGSGYTFDSIKLNDYLKFKANYEKNIFNNSINKSSLIKKNNKI